MVGSSNLIWCGLIRRSSVPQKCQTTFGTFSLCISSIFFSVELYHFRIPSPLIPSTWTKKATWSIETSSFKVCNEKKSTEHFVVVVVVSSFFVSCCLCYCSVRFFRLLNLVKNMSADGKARMWVTYALVVVQSSKYNWLQTIQDSLWIWRFTRVILLASNPDTQKSHISIQLGLNSWS